MVFISIQKLVFFDLIGGKGKQGKQGESALRKWSQAPRFIYGRREINICGENAQRDPTKRPCFKPLDLSMGSSPPAPFLPQLPQFSSLTNLACELVVRSTNIFTLRSPSSWYSTAHSILVLITWITFPDLIRLILLTTSKILTISKTAP